MFLSGAFSLVSRSPAQRQVQAGAQKPNSYQFQTEKLADICPFCRRPTGQLQNMKPIPGLELHGLKTGYYKCSNPDCGKSYDKQVKP
jgi:hypothetical protein